jgi:hypothetical protein
VLALEEAIREKRISPGELPRNLFYLAQSFKDCGYYYQAVNTYKKFLQLDKNITSSDYRYCALIRIADLIEHYIDNSSTENSIIPENLNHIKLDYFLRAREEVPWRREALNYIHQYFTQRGLIKTAWSLIKEGILQEQQDGIFVENTYYNYHYETRYMFTAYEAGDLESFQKINERILRRNDIPEKSRQKYIENRQLYANVDQY